MTQSDKKKRKKTAGSAEGGTRIREEVRRQGRREIEILWRGGLPLAAVRRIHLVYLQAGRFRNDGRGGRHQYDDTRCHSSRNDGGQTEGLRTGTDEEAQAGKGKDLAGRGGRLPDAGHAGRAEAGKGGTETGRYPGVTTTATTNLTANHLVLSGTERQSQSKRSGTAGEGAE